MAKSDKELFEDVPDEFKAIIDAADIVGIKQRLAQVALDQMELMKAKKEDGDLDEKREAYKDAGAIYREGSKANRLKSEYCKVMIESKGGA